MVYLRVNLVVLFRLRRAPLRDIWRQHEQQDKGGATAESNVPRIRPAGC